MRCLVLKQQKSSFPKKFITNINQTNSRRAEMNEHARMKRKSHSKWILHIHSKSRKPVTCRTTTPSDAVISSAVRQSPHFIQFRFCRSSASAYFKYRLISKKHNPTETGRLCGQLFYKFSFFFLSNVWSLSYWPNLRLSAFFGR